MSAKTLTLSVLIVAAVSIAAAVITSGSTARQTFTCNGETATIVGTAGHDLIVGTPGDDVIVGLDGNDHLHGGAGIDVICGGDGDDTLEGGAHYDDLYGGPGNDRLSGGPGGYVYWTGSITDWEGLDGGRGRDDLDRRDLRWGPFPGDRCFLGNATVACPGPRPSEIFE